MRKAAEVVERECLDCQRKAKAILRREIERRERIEKSQAQKRNRDEGRTESEEQSHNY